MRIATRRSSLILISILFVSIGAHARTVAVKYAGVVDLQSHRCTVITRSSFIRELCVDGQQDEVIVQLTNTWYRYCNMSQTAVTAWLSAPSMGRYFNRHVKGKKAC